MACNKSFKNNNRKKVSSLQKLSSSKGKILPSHPPFSPGLPVNPQLPSNTISHNVFARTASVVSVGYLDISYSTDLCSYSFGHFSLKFLLHSRFSITGLTASDSSYSHNAETVSIYFYPLVQGQVCPFSSLAVSYGEEVH